MIARDVAASLTNPLSWWIGAAVTFRALPIHELGAALIEWPRRREANSETSKEAAR